MIESNQARLAIFLGGIAAIFCCAGVGVAENASGVGPRIESCRVGFDDQFKVGFWTPIWVDVSGMQPGASLSIEVVVSDSDGVATTVTARCSSDSILLYAMIGRVGSPIRIALVAGGNEIDHRELASRLAADSDHVASLPATSELILQIGAAATGLSEAFPNRDASEGTLARRVIQVDRVDRLPTEWYGYEGADVLVLSTSDLEMCRQLAADAKRFGAIQRWLELGGRLVFCCGQNAPKLIRASGPLASLVPGTFAELVRLPQTRGLENFAESSAALGHAGAELAIATPRLTDVVGQVEVFGRGNDLPVVVRSPRGFGELAFVGLDLDRPPLVDWPGRNALWRAVLRPYVSSTEGENQPQRLTSMGYSDLSGALHQELGRSFVGVTTITFSAVAALILAYLLVLGPLDYFFVQKLVGRPMWAWFSFPLAVLVTCCGAAGLAQWTKGTRPHVNQAELLDFDSAIGSVRGNFWAALSSPDTDRFDLALEPRLPGGRAATSAETLLSWFGLAGSGIGGMHAGGGALDAARNGYRFATKLDALEGVPILTRSTKSFAAQWRAAAAPPCSAELKLDEDGLVVGTIKNESDAPLVDASLLCGQWGYRLGEIKPGQQVVVGPDLNPIRARTLLARQIHPSTDGEGEAKGQKSFAPDQATAVELVEAMMFYGVLGGESFSHLPNRYQDSCDMSRLLDLGRAIVVARGDGDGDGSQLVEQKSGKPLAGGDDPSTVVYRVVFPIPSKP